MKEESRVRVASKTLKAETWGSIEVHIERHCWTKMHGWCRAANSEVSGQGLAYIQDGNFIVYDVFLPKQKCSSGYTELDDTALGKLNYYLHKKKIDPTHLRFWWHTHYNFSVFWSGTDDNCAQELMKSNGEWSLSLVINQKGDWLCRMDMMKPINVTIDELPVFLIPNTRKRKRKRNFKSDIKRWVKPINEPKVTDTTVGYSYNWDSFIPPSDRFKEWTSGFQSYWKKEDENSWINAKKERYVDWRSKYVYYGDRMVTKDEYDRLKAAEKQLEQGQCECGEAFCVNFDACEPCPKCGYRVSCVDSRCKKCNEEVNLWDKESKNGTIPEPESFGG